MSTQRPRKSGRWKLKASHLEVSWTGAEHERSWDGLGVGLGWACQVWGLGLGVDVSV